MSIFSALTQLSSAINSAVMGERVRIVPMSPARWQAAAADPARPVVEADGIYREIVARLKPMGENAMGRDFAHEFMTPKITISIRRAELGGVDYVKGDRITRLEVPTSPELEISAVDPIDDRLAFTVVAVSE